ncbi:MAG: helix-turn-helix transcriptional regulator [Patescibacteria group bacterium]
MGEKIYSARKKHKLTQEKLSEISDVDRTYISQIEKGHRNPSIEIVSKLSRALDLRVDDVIGNNKKKKRQKKK